MGEIGKKQAKKRKGSRERKGEREKQRERQDVIKWEREMASEKEI